MMKLGILWGAVEDAETGGAAGAGAEAGVEAVVSGAEGVSDIHDVCSSCNQALKRVEQILRRSTQSDVARKVINLR
jgi:hypothetical protein